MRLFSAGMIDTICSNYTCNQRASELRCPFVKSLFIEQDRHSGLKYARIKPKRTDLWRGMQTAVSEFESTIRASVATSGEESVRDETRRNVYLDYSASTPVDQRVLEAMMPYFGEVYGNSTSAHMQGRRAESAIEDARLMIANVLNCRPTEVIFTSCGSESDNLAIRGAIFPARRQRKPSRLITTPVEHSAVTNTVLQLSEQMDIEADIVPVDRFGMVDADSFRAACQQGGALASVIYANNELGSIKRPGWTVSHRS